MSVPVAKLRLILCSLLLLCGSLLHGQTVVSGVCLSASDRSLFVGCNVIVYDASGKSILGFSTSDAEGRWEVKLKTTVEGSIRVAATGFNIEKTEMVANAPYTGVVVLVKEAKLSIKESVVKVEPIKQAGDTVTYNVSSFKTETDRTIADVLGRMPGIEVDESGGIKYHGRAINKFYVEGLDMLGSSYGIASSSIRAEDVLSVEVYERHQPIKSLRELVPSDNSAVNLKLKSSAKGTWSGSVEGGGGYSPLLWNAGVTGMFFGKGFQTLDIYKGNNEGDRNARMLKEQVRGIDALGNIVSVSIPFSASISEDRYLELTEHALSGNVLSKINDDVTFRSNVSIVSSHEQMNGSSSSDYYFADGQKVSYNESLSLQRHSKKVSFEGQLEKNSDKTYFRDNVKVTGQWNSESGTVMESGSGSAQNAEHRLVTIANDLSGSIRLGDNAIRFTSTTGYQQLPETLDIASALQRGRQSYLSSSNRAHVTLTKGAWTYDPGVSFKYNGHWLESEMNRTGESTPDSLRNGRFAGRTELQLQNSTGWKPKYWFRLGISLPLGVIAMTHDDRLRDNRSSETHLYVTPSIYNELNLSQSFGMTTRLTYSDVYGDDSHWYPGYVMNTYRTIRKSDKFAQKSQRTTLLSSLKYTNAPKALFCNFDITLMREGRDYISSTDYAGGFLTDNVLEYRNTVRSAQFSLGVSKGLNAILGNIDLRLDYMIGNSPYMRQGAVLDSRSDIYAGTVSFTSNPLESIDIKYNGTARMGQTSMDSYQMPSTVSVSQNLQIGIRLHEGLWWKTGAQDYYNTISNGTGHNIMFVDSGLSLKRRRVEYSLIARNLTNAKTIETSYVNTLNTHVQSLALKPLSVIFRLEVSL